MRRKGVIIDNISLFIDLFIDQCSAITVSGFSRTKATCIIPDLWS